MYIYIYVYVYVCIYIYIERERDIHNTSTDNSLQDRLPAVDLHAARAEPRADAAAVHAGYNMISYKHI